MASIRVCDAHLPRTIMLSIVYAELRDRGARIDLLKKKYEVLHMSIASSADGEVHSQAYYLVKAAQERHELQKAGDELDLKIRKGEKEMRALQNTLDVMNNRNQQYRHALTKADPTSLEAQQREDLDGAVCCNFVAGLVVIFWPRGAFS